MKRDTNFFTPSTRVMARNSLNKVGCGTDIVYGHWTHSIQLFMLAGFPAWIRDRIAISFVKGLRQKEQAGQKIH